VIKPTMFRFTWVHSYLGLGVALVAWPACGPADNDGDLDVLSNLSDAGASPDDVNAPPASDCVSKTVACRSCSNVTMCLAPWVDCTADGPCRMGNATLTSCTCDAQSTDSGAIASCETAFRATGTRAAALMDCMVTHCASECGF